MELHLEKKNALILASSQGLGKAMAAELVKEGANVMLASRDGEKLAAVQRELSQLGAGKVAYMVTDITKAEDIKSLVGKTVEELGGIDILINNAGGPQDHLQISMMKNGNNLSNLIY